MPKEMIRVVDHLLEFRFSHCRRKFNILRIDLEDTAKADRSRKSSTIN